MRIRQVTTRRFRSLPDEGVSLAPGLQIVRGDNEAGKSSLLEAIEIGLYVTATSVDRSYAGAMRWGETEPIEVRLVLDVPGGPFTVVRDFAGRKNLLLGPDGVPRKAPALDQVLAEHVPLATVQAFRAIACVHQDQLVEIVKHPEDLKRLLEQHAISGTPGVDLSKLRKDLAATVGALRRGTVGMAKRPGQIKEQADRVDAARQRVQTLSAKVATQSDALTRLQTLRADHQQLTEEQAVTAERIKRHREITEAEKSRDDSAHSLEDADQTLQAIIRAETALPGLRDQEARAQAALAAQRERVEQAEGAHSAETALAAAAEKLRLVTQDVDELAAVAQHLAECQAALEALPMAREDLGNLEALPGEIAKIGADVAAADAERAQDRADLAAAEAARDAWLGIVRELGTQRSAAEQALERAQQRATLAESSSQGDAALGDLLVRILELRELTTTHASLQIQLQGASRLDGVTPEAVTRIQDTLAMTQQALAAEAFAVTVTPRVPLDLKVTTDQDPAQAHPQQRTTLEVQARRQVGIEIAGVADIEVRNTGNLAAQLRTAEAAETALLRRVGVTTLAEALQVVQAHGECGAACRRAHDALARTLGTDTLAGLEAEFATREAEQQARQAELEAMAGDARGVEEIRQELQALGEQGAEARAQADALGKQIEQLRGRVGRDRMAGTREELQRKAAALATLQAVLGPDPAAARTLKAQYAELDERIRVATETRTRILGRRTPESLAETQYALTGEVETARAHWAEVAGGHLDPEALQALRDAIPGVEQAVKEAERLRMEAELLLKNQNKDKLAQTKRVALTANARAEDTLTRLAGFKMTPEEVIRCERRQQDLETLVPLKFRELVTLEASAEDEEAVQTQLADAEEALATAERRLAYYEQRAAVDDEICALLEEARASAVATLTAHHLPQLIGSYLGHATRGRYIQVTAAGTAYQIVSARKGGVLAESEISTGTRDQAYLAMRLAYLHALFPTQRPPLILDDPLVHCDPSRRAAILEMLAGYADGSDGGQVLLFTCHDFAEYAPYAPVWLNPSGSARGA